MRFSDFVDMIHTDDADLTVFVFDSEMERDEYRKGENNDGLLFAATSPYKMDFFLKERFANAHVLCCCPVSKNAVDVIIEEV